MRIVCGLLLLIVVAAVAVVAVQNSESIGVNVLNQTVGVSLPLLVAVTYVLGMVSGWTILGLLRRSLHGATDSSHKHA
jgi:uncharacterized membrane protein YciS (DUF1049 family)